MKQGKEYMNKMRSLTELEVREKKNQTEILELNSTLNKNKKCNKENQHQNRSNLQKESVNQKTGPLKLQSENNEKQWKE